MVPVGPVLVAATYEEQTAVTLVFARPVTVTADSMAAVWVYDGGSGEQFQGDDFAIVSPTTIRVSLYSQDAFTGEGVTLTVRSPSGIVDAGNETEWPGASGVALPFAA